MKFTDEQQAVIDSAAAMGDGDSLKIDACAGSGKTSTLLGISKACPDRKILYLAFNRAVAEHCRNLFPENVDVQTLHAMAYHRMHRSYSGMFFSGSGPAAAAYTPYLKDGDFRDVGQMRASLMHYLIRNPAVGEKDPPEFARFFQDMRTGRLPMIHDLYLHDFMVAGKASAALKKYDLVLLDEAQDTNEVSMGLLNSARGARILVGDTHQSIYGFRGAINALPRFHAETSLRLTGCFRCRQQILDQADWFLHEYADDRKTLPSMRALTPGNKHYGKASQAVLTRLNATMISIIDQMSPHERLNTKLLRPAFEIFTPALYIYDAFFAGQKAKSYIPPQWKFLLKYSSVEEAQKETASFEDPELKAAFVAVRHYKKYLIPLYKEAQKMNGHDDAKQVLANVYSSKGLEYDQVTLKDDFPHLAEISSGVSPSKNAFQSDPEKFQQELNLYYVALTRARAEVQDETKNAPDYELSLSHDIQHSQAM